MTSEHRLSAPFPYPGGKSRVADVVWSRLGDVRCYIEPFCGSMAMLLARPHEPTFEIVNDADGLLVNFWRATKADPRAVARWAQAPKSEIDLQARHNYTLEVMASHVDRLRDDPEYYDAQIAGYWVYFKGAVVGGRGAFAERFGSRIPDVVVERGIFSLERRADLAGFMVNLADRPQHVTIACGDWSRVVGNASIGYRTPVGVFLDPPYAGAGEEWDGGLYTGAGDVSNVFAEVLEWCRANGDNPSLRIALCGYEGIEPPDGWSTHAWSAHGGMGHMAKTKRGADESRSMANKDRERIWFSPGCLASAQSTLFSVGGV